jgi:hypothetical protein
LELDELGVVLDDELEVEVPLDDPGTPGWLADAGGVPIGGVVDFWEDSHDWNVAWGTTCTLERIRPCPAPHSSVHSTG